MNNLKINSFLKVMSLVLFLSFSLFFCEESGETITFNVVGNAKALASGAADDTDATAVACKAIETALKGKFDGFDKAAVTTKVVKGSDTAAIGAAELQCEIAISGEDGNKETSFNLDPSTAKETSADKGKANCEALGTALSQAVIKKGETSATNAVIADKSIEWKDDACSVKSE